MTAGGAEDFEAIRGRIDRRLESVLPKAIAAQGALDEALRDGVLAPGKRLRPLMTVLVAEDLGGCGEAALDAGCAVEMVHAASLVLDDLPCMDNATLRRGQPAVHVGHGEDVAVLVAIAALSGAYGLLAALPGIAPEARLRAVTILASSVGTAGLVGGQFADLRGGRAMRPTAEIEAANGLKTGSLFLASVELGGIVAGAGAGEMARLRAFAEELGHGFQLLDDLLDGGRSAALLGKDVGQDHGKSTIVAVMGRAPVRRRIERHVVAAGTALEAVFGRRSRMQTLMEGLFARALADTLADDGAEAPGRAALERQV